MPWLVCSPGLQHLLPAHLVTGANHISAIGKVHAGPVTILDSMSNPE
jgi:hypothetical protein